MPSNTALINGSPVSVDGIVLIRPVTEFTYLDEREIPTSYVPQAMVYTLNKKPRDAKRSVEELAAALGFVTVLSGAQVVALNPNFSHYHIAQVQEEDRYRKGQLTKVSWKVDGRERFVYINNTMDEVLGLLPKAARHMITSSVIQASRPSVVREMPLAGRDADV